MSTVIVKELKISELVEVGGCSKVNLMKLKIYD